jgi:integrase
MAEPTGRERAVAGPASLDAVSPTTTLDDLLQLPTAQALRDLKPATLKGYDADWRDFTGWCATHRHAALPAQPQTVVAYLSAHADHLAIPTLRRRLAAISQCHQAAGHPNPGAAREVRMEWHHIVNTHSRPPREPEPILTPTLRQLLDVVDDGIAGCRDRALLLFLFAGALRRSDLVNLDVADVTPIPEGLELFVAAAPRDYRVRELHHGEHPETNPVRAWQTWLAVSRITDGPAFREVGRYGNVATGRLAGKAVTRLIKRLAARAGLDPAPFSAHSLRAGLAVAAAQAGFPVEAIMVQGGWSTRAAVYPYARKGARRQGVPAAKVGL